MSTCFDCVEAGEPQLMAGRSPGATLTAASFGIMRKCCPK